MAEMALRSVMTVHPPTHMLTCGVRPKVTRPYHQLPVFGYGAGMSAQPAESSVPARKCPAKNLDAISHVLDSPEVDEDVRARFRTAYAKAWTAAKNGLAIQPLLDLVEGWFPEAVLWSDPADARAYNAKIDRYVRLGGIPPEERADPDEVLAIFEAKGVSGPVLDKLRNLAARR